MPKPRQTCTECSLRRQKCDRQVPCGRCVKRGIANQCKTEWPENNGSKTRYPLPRDTSELEPAPQRTDLRHLQDLVNSDDSQYGQEDDDYPRRDSRSVNVNVLSNAEMLRRMTSASSENRTFDTIRSEHMDAEDAPTTLEFLAWGRKRSSNQADEASKEGQSHDLSTPLTPGLGFSSTKIAQIGFLQLLIPSMTQMYQLVNYHEKQLLWYHGCYHGPTFRGELDAKAVAQRLRDSDSLRINERDLQWTALLFAIISGSITCASDTTLAAWRFRKAEAQKLSRQWYKATISCLNLAEYTSHHHICSVHAIATLTMSAHTLGFSNDQSVLLGAALKIAQSLGLHRLSIDPEVDSISEQSTPLQRARVLKREIGRRLWSQLCIQDWFSIPFSESHAINLLHFTTSKPSNRDHLTMMPLSNDIPTYVSYGNYLFEIAALIASLHEAMSHSSTPYTKYESVLEYDGKMRSLATKGRPRYFDVTEPIAEDWPEFVPWARRSLTICFAHKIMMIHRTFLGPSFTNPAFALTRMTCIAASKTILNEAKQEKDTDGPIIWIDQAFCVAAGITLALDIMHRSEGEPETDVHRRLVEDCIDMLRKYNNSMIANRGVHLLLTLLSSSKIETSRHGSTTTRDKRRRSSNVNFQSEPSAKRSKLDTAELVKSLVELGSECPSPRPTNNTNMDDFTDVLQDFEEGETHDMTYEAFAELFPPQTGFCNSFLFEELLNFDEVS